MKKINLGDVLDIKRGCSLSGEYYSSSGKYIRLTLGNFDYPNNGFKDNESKDNLYFIGTIKDEYILKKGDIITPLTEQVRGLLGNTATIPESGKYIQSGDIGLVECDITKIDKRFSYYLISSPIVKRQLDTGSQQTKIRHTSPDAIKSCIAFIPSIEEQKRISEILDFINLKISINKRINENLSQQISLIFDFWFKQFNFPNEVGQPYAQNGGMLIFDPILKRTIPAGWSSGSLTRNPFSKPIEPGVEYFYRKNYLATANITGTAITDGEYVTYEGRESRANMQPKAFSVWFAKMKNSVKHLFISKAGQYFLDKYILSTGFEGLLCNPYAFAYICGIISDPTFEVTKDRYSHGATQQSVNNDDLDLYKIPLPPLRILQEYSKIVDPFYEKMNYLVAETNQLMAVRDYLLPLLLNGQVTVR